MPAQQIQQWSDERVRVRAQQIRALYNSLTDDLSSIGQVYAMLNDAGVEWADNRTDAPPTLLTKNDLLAVNTFVSDIRTAIANNAQLPIILKACVHAV